MELTGFFTARADLPGDALAISVTTHLDAANALAEMIRKYNGEDIATSMLQHIVPDVFVQYEPGPDAPADPALTPRRAVLLPQQGRARTPVRYPRLVRQLRPGWARLIKNKTRGVG